MKIVVTGSSGHIGGAAAHRLHGQGHEVIGISRTPSKGLRNHVEQLSLDIGHHSFVRDARKAIGGCDAIVHAAACQEHALTALDIARTNCLGVQQILCMATELQAHTVVYLSSLSVLGAPCEHPVTETHPIAPASVYGASKLFGEQLVCNADAHALRGVALRVSSPVGPGLNYKRIFRVFVENAIAGRDIVLHGKGTRRQDYVDVRDIAEAIESALIRDVRGVFHIGAGVPVSNLELAEACKETLASQSEIAFSGDPDPSDDVCWDISIEKARKRLGYTPSHTLRQSIRDLAAEISGDSRPTEDGG